MTISFYLLQYTYVRVPLANNIRGHEKFTQRNPSTWHSDK